MVRNILNQSPLHNVNHKVLSSNVEYGRQGSTVETKPCTAYETAIRIEHRLIYMKTLH